MKKRNLRVVFLLNIVTLGIYLLYWCAHSKKEVNNILGQKAVPTMWWFIVPFGSYWWVWLYAEALEQATTKRIKRDFTFGIWIIATLGLGGILDYSHNFPFHFNTTSTTDHIHWSSVVIVAAIVYVLFTAVVGLFPTIIQSKINNLVPTGQA